MSVQIAKLFYNGRSQAMRLPKEFRFLGTEVYVRKVGDSLIVSPKRPSWDEFFSTPSAFGDDFLIERDNTLPQEREWF
jgi:antitoxin VapB